MSFRFIWLILGSLRRGTHSELKVEVTPMRKSPSRRSLKRSRTLRFDSLESRQLLSLTLTPSSSQSSLEGATASVQLGAFNDTDPAGSPWQIGINWGDNSSSSLTLSSAGTIPAQTHLFDASGTYSITETITNARGASLSSTIPFTVRNVAPTVKIGSTSYAATVSNPLVFTAAATDPSKADTAAGFVYTWNFGDGSAPFSGLNLSQVTHVYTTSGSYTISVTATDQAGGTSLASSAAVTATILPIPLLSQWQSQMITFGKLNAAALADPTVTNDTLLAETYYDAERVFYQIANYTGDSSWITAALNAQKAYRDYYVLPNNGMVPGYWDFAKGLEMNYLLTGDPVSKQAVLELASNAAFASDLTPIEWSADSGYSREVAYNIATKIAAEELGAPHDPKLDQFVNQALGDIDQWFISKTATVIQPFMVGLTSEALITWYNRTGDSRVLPAIQTAMDSIWSTLWDGASQSFLYENVVVPGDGGPTPAPDLNLLIAPAYAWLYHMTGNTKYRDIGDQVFAGGVQGAWLYNNKQFNQNYRWSFDYVNWRTENPLSSPTPTTPALAVVAGQTVNEGSPIAVSLGTLTDLNPLDTAWSVSINWGDGSSPTQFSVTSTGALPSKSHTYNDNGTYTVTETVVASSGTVGSQSTLIRVLNVAPTVSIPQGPYAVSVYDHLAIPATVTDPSSVDTAAGFTMTWNFGDGSAPVTGLGLTQPSHVYLTAGTYTVTVTATDKDGGVSNVATSTVIATLVPIPELSRWESQMTTYAQVYAAQIAKNPSLVLLPGYDLSQIYDQIGMYTGNMSWFNTANIAETYYRNQYVLPKNGAVSGQLNFGQGLMFDYFMNGNSSSLKALNLLVRYATSGGTTTSLSTTADPSKSVELANAILTDMAAAAAGVPAINQISLLVDQALNDINQWFVTKTATIQPANVGMILNALTVWQGASGDPRILPAIQTAADWLWANSWNPSTGMFQSVVTGTNSLQASQTDANLMISPAFAWIYNQTGNDTYRDRGDQIFAAGVDGASFGSSLTAFAMDFNWSFNYVAWRSQPTLA